MKKKFLNKKIIPSLMLSTLTASAAISIGVVTTNGIHSTNKISNTSTELYSDDSSLVESQSNGQNANLSMATGPVTYWNDQITALDWYGNKIWTVDMNSYITTPSGGFTGSWRRAWFNWDYNRTQDILWVLGYGNNTSKQKLIGFQGSNGKVLYNIDLGITSYRFLSALSSGSVIAYGGAGSSFDGTGLLFTPDSSGSTGTVKNISGNSKNKINDLTSKEQSINGNSVQSANYKWYFFNIIPLASGKNLVELVTFDAKQSGTTGDNSADNATYNVWGMLVDDELNFIGDQQSTSSQFYQPILLAKGMQGYRNTSITPQRDYYTLLNGKTTTVLYNTVLTFDVSNTSSIKMTSTKMSDNNWILTWAVDANDNLFFKYKSDVKVYKVDSSTLKQGNSTGLSPTTYIDLSGFSSISSFAKNFVIYNVYGFTGQLMLLNSSYSDYINNNDKNNIKPTDNSTTLWGLAIAVVPNTSSNTQGDLKGILNGNNSIYKAASFSISDNTLNNKIPSEITYSDLVLENDAFFKSNQTNKLILQNIDDSKGTFNATAFLYQYPWFSTNLSDAMLKVVTLNFDGTGNSTNKAQLIKDKVSWLTLDSTNNYDFLNMLPSKVTESDLNELDPFQVSFQSNEIASYPSKTYTITGKNDTTGELTVQVVYKYVPMNVTYSSSEGETKTITENGTTYKVQQVLSYTTSHTYNLFKKSDQAKFVFMGASGTSDNQTIDVRNVPQLKNLLSSSTIPSSFSSLTNSKDFLQFINTSNSKGYPISKMSFSVEANDTDGTLKITATIPESYSPNNKTETFVVTYTNLNKISNYSLSIDESKTEISGKKISEILPSSVNEGDIVSTFITYSGYTSTNFTITLTPNDENGSLTVQIYLDKSYASAIGSSGHGFTNYSTSFTISGFMKTSEYNSRYSIIAIDDSDNSLLTLKQMQVDQIISTFGVSASNFKSGVQEKEYILNNVKYKNLNDFVRKNFISGVGTLVPYDWGVQENINITPLYDNSLGEISFLINIPKSLLSNSESDLNVLYNYSGFVKGNAVQTADNLSFIPSNMLESYLVAQNIFSAEEYSKLKASDLKAWLEKDKNFEMLITYKTGQYSTLIASGNYTKTIIANDTQKTLTVSIYFSSLTNENSIKEYIAQYSI